MQFWTSEEDGEQDLAAWLATQPHNEAEGGYDAEVIELPGAAASE
jgi:hypothetical protein